MQMIDRIYDLQIFYKYRQVLIYRFIKKKTTSIIYYKFSCFHRKKERCVYMNGKISLIFFTYTGESGNKSVTRHSLCESNGLDRVTEVHG